MKWTVYSEEKPQKVGSYLVTHITESGHSYVDYDYWTVLDKFKYHPTEVVAWMPFPKPYEAEQTEPSTTITIGTPSNKYKLKNGQTGNEPNLTIGQHNPSIDCPWK